MYAVRFGKTKSRAAFNTVKLNSINGEIMTKHNRRFIGSAIALLLGIVCTTYGGVPPMEVTVFDASGNVGFKGATSANGTFATANLHPGRYVVQFKTRNAAAKSNQYLLVLSAGKKKVLATNVSGETFLGGGAAMKVNVERGLKITGQVANEQTMTHQGGPNYRVIGGQRFVWVTAELGSNLGGHWVEESMAPTRNISRWNLDQMRKMQDHGGEGSMISYHPMDHGPY
jgi:hypothetical protein